MKTENRNLAEECEVVKGVEHMTFDEWWSSYIKPASIYTLKETTEDAWEAGIQEGLGRNCEWVGLTQDEIDNMDLPDWSTREELVWIIEAKLKEKNT